MSEEVRQVVHVELAHDRRQNETVRPTDHVTDSLFKGPKQGSATLSIDRCRVASIGVQEHSQSPDLQAQHADGQAYAKKANRMVGNQGIISSQFSFEGEMMICSSGPLKLLEEQKPLLQDV